MTCFVTVCWVFVSSTTLAVAPGSAPITGQPGQANVPMPARLLGVNVDAMRMAAGRPLGAQVAPRPPEQPPVGAPHDATPVAGVLTADTMATQVKPEGFAYTIVRDAICDELSETFLYVKANKDAKTTTAVPVPKDRVLLAQCLAGGEIGDLVRGTIVTVRYDPKGVVRPEIVISEVPKIEVLDNAKIADRAGSKLFVVTADKQTRAFSIEGGAPAWASVVQNGKAEDLTPGTLVRIDYDPSGREGIKITLKNPPVQAAPAEDKGCGCSVYGGQRALPLANLLFALVMVAVVLGRRSRKVP